MAGLTLINIKKHWKDSDNATLHEINLQVDPDEFLVLLGPSGCGKSTLLRIISGLVKPTDGQVLIDGEDVTELEPQDRGIGMVFQNYALFPHMTIQKNLSFPLDVAHGKKPEKKAAVERVSELLDIGRHLKKKPHMLSGGERQRVAMGRAMVKENRVYLFDEPLSNLDDNMRTRLRPEILALFHQLKVPFVYVTHDQVDAMTMGTRIAVMDQGLIQQLGTPAEIYDTPANMFVASFVGTPKINFLPAAVVRQEDGLRLACGDLTLELPQYAQALAENEGRAITLGIRPEDLLTVQTRDTAPYLAAMECTLTHYEHLGNKVNLFVDHQHTRLTLTAPVNVRARVGQTLTVYLDTRKVHLFDTQTQKRL